MEVLAKLPEKTKQKMVLVHTTADKVPPESGLKTGKIHEGVSNSIVLI